MAGVERGSELQGALDRVSIREVVGESFATFARAPWILMSIGMLPSLTGLVFDVARFAVGPETDLAALIKAADIVVQVGLTVTVQGAATAGANRLIAGERFGVGSAFRIGIRRGAPLFVLNLLAALIILLGLLCLVVPGFIAMLGFSVATPACVIEETSAVASLKRSWALTRGHRWRILGLALASIVLVLLVVALGAAIAAAVALGLGSLHVAKPIAVLFTVLAFIPAFAVLVGCVPVVPVVLFHRLGGGIVAGPWSATSLSPATPGIRA